MTTSMNNKESFDIIVEADKQFFYSTGRPVNIILGSFPQSG